MQLVWLACFKRKEEVNIAKKTQANHKPSPLRKHKSPSGGFLAAIARTVFRPVSEINFDILQINAQSGTKDSDQ